MNFLVRLLIIFSSSVVILIPGKVDAQTYQIDRLLTAPIKYTVLKTEKEFIIDGKDTETQWNRAPWTNLFTDIKTGEADDLEFKTKAKMLWDNEYLYMYVLLEESNIWASLKGHDSAVFQDNAFEIFIDPDGDSHNYFEIQINAYGTVWDLFMYKPYRNGGKSLSSWDLKGLLKAIQINGTLNIPYDKDIGWSIELAIPFNSLKMGGENTPNDGTIWRMNLSRVDWALEVVDGQYQRQRDKNTGKLIPEQYTVWSPQGIVNLHYPERYGYLFFSENSLPPTSFSNNIDTCILLLWKYYYLQQEYQKEMGVFAITLNQLRKVYPEIVVLEDESKVTLYATEYQFRIQTFSTHSNKNIAIDEQGKVHVF